MSWTPTKWRVGALCAFVGGFAAWPAQAFEFANEDVTWFGSWDTTVSWGIQSRQENPDPAIIGIANGGTAFGINADDGNLNFPDQGLVSNLLKVTTELELHHETNFGAFFRAFAFKDFEVDGKTLPFRQLSDTAEDLVGSDIRLLDAYVWFNFRLGENPAELRLGQQVLSWGESTFIQGGINIINPIDVPAIRLPGAELREALLPITMVSFNTSLTDTLSLEAFYSLEWDAVEPDPPGSYFSSNDFVGQGGRIVMLGFGAIPDNFAPTDRTFPGQVPPAMVERGIGPRPYNGVLRGPTEKADDEGEFGLNLRWFSGNTEWGFYYINYHSRLPLINVRTGTQAGLGNAAAAGAAATCLAGGAIPAGCPAGDPAAAIAFGAATGAALGADDPTGAASAGINAALGLMPSFPAGNPALGVGQTVTDLYASTASYFISYPENINLFGVSWNTAIGDTAFQGEVSHRLNAPFQIDDLEILFAGLSPLDAITGGSLGALGQLGPQPLNTVVPGFFESDMTQLQFTFTRTIRQFLGADQIVLLGEFGFESYHDLPSKDTLRLDGPGTFISGNAPLAATGQVHIPTAIGTIETPDAFPDDFAWGYVLVGRFDYLNAIGAVNVRPRFAWRQDVSGVSPRPSGNFLEDRTSWTIGLGFDYQRVWEWDLSYTAFGDAGRYNLINDRDFFGFNVKYSF